jgi:hypothetical protein
MTLLGEDTGWPAQVVTAESPTSSGRPRRFSPDGVRFVIHRS